MPSTLSAGGLTLGAGRPKICLPLCGANREELARELAGLDRLRPDLIEWRADSYESLCEPGELEQVLSWLRECIGALPLLLTIRMAEEGGAASIPDMRRAELYLRALEAGGCQLLDLELAAQPGPRDSVVQAAKAAGVPVVLSHHNFAITPQPEEMVAILQRQRDAGADIAKLAVTPNSPEDLLALFSATLRARRELDTVLITISMGRIGALSRVSGVFGSAVSYGSGLNSTAPGQVDARSLRDILEALDPDQQF